MYFWPGLCPDPAGGKLAASVAQILHIVECFAAGNTHKNGGKEQMEGR